MGQSCCSSEIEVCWVDCSREVVAAVALSWWVGCSREVVAAVALSCWVGCSREVVAAVALSCWVGCSREVVAGVALKWLGSLHRRYRWRTRKPSKLVGLILDTVTVLRYGLEGMSYNLLHSFAE